MKAGAGHRVWVLIAAGMLSVALFGASAHGAPSGTGTGAGEATHSPAAPVLDHPGKMLRELARAVTVSGDEGRPQAERDAAWATVERCLPFDAAGVAPDLSLRRKIAAKLVAVLDTLRPLDARTRFAADAPIGDELRIVYYPIDGDRYHAAISERVRQQVGWPVQITLEKADDGQWGLSTRAVMDARDVHFAVEDIDRKSEVRRIAPDVAAEEEAAEEAGEEPLVRQLVPESMKADALFDLEYWQWIGLLVIVLTGVVVDYTLRFVLRLSVQRMIAGQDAEAKRETIVSTMRPLGLTAAALVWLGLLYLLALPETARFVLMAAVNVFVVLTGTWGAWKVVDLAAEVLATRAARTATRFDDVLIPLIRKTLKVFIVAFGLVYGANALNIPIIPLLTGLGIGGVAFAFAAKDTVENFFGSVAVLIDRPFDVGDWIVVGDTEGIVEEVGFRSTRVRTFYNSQVTVPNSNLVRAVVDNYGRRRYRRWKANVGIQYDTPPDKIVAFTEGIRELIRTHPYTRKDYFQVWLTGFGASSLDILLYIFHEVPDWSTELRERERLILDIVRLADQLGVQFAFPTQTVHVHRGQTPEPGRHDQPQSMTDRRAQVTGIRKAQSLTENQPWTREKPGPVVFADGPTHVEIDPETGEPVENFIEDTTAGS